MNAIRIDYQASTWYLDPHPDYYFDRSPDASHTKSMASFSALIHVILLALVVYSTTTVLMRGFEDRFTKHCLSAKYSLLLSSQHYRTSVYLL
jgi:ABC-type lipoprotein release transport system permease subunit